jgi:uncharacterized membrane protein YoaK (UPF0700 family)
MSGNSVAAGAYLGMHDWREAFHRAFPIPCFVLGVLSGAALTETLIRRQVRSVMAVVVSIEASLLSLYLVGGRRWASPEFLRAGVSWQFYLLVALPALAMGIQNTALRRISRNTTVRTTYVTGMLTNFAEEVIAYLFWLHAHTRQRTPRRKGQVLRVSARQPALNRMVLFGGIWCFYLGGALLGGYAQQRWALACLGGPLAVLIIVALVDCVRPVRAATLSR